jgi:hypothetical protein
MADGLAGYKAYIDGLVRLVEVHAHIAARLRQGNTLYEAHQVEEMRYNHLATQLSAAQRELVADLIQRERQAANGDVLDFLAWKPFGVTWEGVALPSEPFETEMQHDFIARLEGETWPDERPADEELPG